MENDILNKLNLEERNVSVETEDIALSVLSELEKRRENPSVTMSTIGPVPIVNSENPDLSKSISSQDIKPSPIIVNTEDQARFIDFISILGGEVYKVVVVGEDKSHKSKFIKDPISSAIFVDRTSFPSYYRKTLSEGVTPIFVFVEGLDTNDVQKELTGKQKDGKFLSTAEKEQIQGMSIYLEKESSEDGIIFIQNCLESIKEYTKPEDMRDSFLNIIKEFKSKGIDPQLALVKLLSDPNKILDIQKFLNLELRDSFIKDLSKGTILNTVLTLVLFSKLLNSNMGQFESDNLKGFLHYHYNSIKNQYGDYFSISPLLGSNLHSLYETKSKGLSNKNKFRLLFKYKPGPNNTRIPIFLLFKDVHHNP